MQCELDIRQDKAVWETCKATNHTLFSFTWHLRAKQSEIRYNTVAAWELTNTTLFPSGLIKSCAPWLIGPYPKWPIYMDFQSCDFHLNISAHLLFYDSEGSSWAPPLSPHWCRFHRIIDCYHLCGITSSTEGVHCILNITQEQSYSASEITTMQKVPGWYDICVQHPCLLG